MKLLPQAPINSSSKEVEEVNQLKWFFVVGFFFQIRNQSEETMLWRAKNEEGQRIVGAINKSSYLRCSIQKLVLNFHNINI